ncbi:MAG: TrkH family potassium uptake protein [Bacteroidetes bacterium]|nr:TrkH family potassium uptake protein [Bacteroidota bacterium]
MGKREGYLIASLIWVVYSIFGALPFMISGKIPSFTDAFFETMSGFTTTGASILKEVESLPHGILLWRSMTHLVGGIGILLVSIVVLPVFGTGSMYLYGAEASSVSTGKLHPKIKDTASRLLWIYLSFTALLTVLLWLGGMNLFDSICHSFGTIASGGFSTKNSSLINYSPYIQYTISVFMIIAAINFNLHYFLLKGAFKKVFQNEELKLFMGILTGAVLVIGLSLFIIHDYDAERAFRDAFFNVSTIISTTGYANTDYMLWQPFIWFVLFLLMFIGGCAGSTAGGIKVVRYLLLFRNIPVQFRKLLHERGVIAARLNGEIVNEELIFRTLAFFIIYLFIWVVSTFLLMFTGLPLLESMGGAAASMSCVGPGLGSVGPVGNFSALTDFAKWVLSFDMLAGRLEIFSFLILFTPFFWKNK